MSLAIDAAYVLSNKILYLANKNIDPNYNVDYFKMHILLYYAQGTMLSVYNIPFFIEPIIAETIGPFIGASPCRYILFNNDGLHTFYQQFGISKLQKYIKDDYPISLTSNRLKVLDYIAQKYGNIDRNTLIFESKKQLPYLQTLANNGKFISENLLKQFFDTIVDKSYFV